MTKIFYCWTNVWKGSGLDTVKHNQIWKKTTSSNASSFINSVANTTTNTSTTATKTAGLLDKMIYV